MKELALGTWVSAVAPRSRTAESAKATRFIVGRS
jgi:hypothetical protein